jgi:hypothetical protein
MYGKNEKTNKDTAKKTKTLAALDKYILFIKKHENYIKSEKIILHSISNYIQDYDIKDNMASISKEIDKLLIENLQIKKQHI